MVRVQFENRAETGQYLATKLRRYADRPDVLVLARNYARAVKMDGTSISPLDVRRYCREQST